MSGLSAAGFEIKRLPQIKKELEQGIQDALGVIIDFSPDAPDGQISGVMSEVEAQLWQLAEAIYQSQYPSTADGINLDRVVDLNGITRLSATPTTSTVVVVFGDVGTVLMNGRQASNSQTGDLYQLVTGQLPVTISTTNAVRVGFEVATVADSTLYRITIGGVNYDYTSGAGTTAQTILTGLASALPVTVDTDLQSDRLVIEYDTPANVSVSSNLSIEEVGNLARFDALVSGRKLLPAGTLDKIETPVSGWVGLRNRTDGIPGRNRETDIELRERRINSIGINATAMLDAIFANLTQLDGVSSVTVRDNRGTVTDSNGIPPQHIWAIVSGGDDAEIAEVLFKKTSGGIGFKGDEEVTVISEVTGNSTLVKFDRPISVDVYISIDITIDENIYPSDGDDLIRDALEAFGSSLISGDDLIFSRLYTPINSIPGFYVTDLRADIINPPTGQSNIVTALNERIAIAAERIAINVTIG